MWSLNPHRLGFMWSPNTHTHPPMDPSGALSQLEQAREKAIAFYPNNCNKYSENHQYNWTVSSSPIKENPSCSSHWGVLIKSCCPIRYKNQSQTWSVLSLLLVERERERGTHRERENPLPFLSLISVRERERESQHTTFSLSKFYLFS